MNKYSNYSPHAQKPGTYPVTIAYLQKERQLIKDMRRRANGLPPKTAPVENLTVASITYDEQATRP